MNELKGQSFVFLYGGQGSQVAGMGRDFAERYPETEAFYSHFFTRYPVYNKLLDPSFDKINETFYAQPALTLFGIAVTRMLREKGVEPAAAAGLSIGEFPALAAAGIYSYASVLDIVAKRAALMDRRLKKRREDGFEDGMLAIVGLGKDVVEAQLTPFGRKISITNINAPTQVVVGGERATLEKVRDAVLEAGARRAVMLECEGAFHTSIFDDEVEELAAEISAHRASEPDIPVPLNALGGFVSEENVPEDILSLQASERYARLMSYQMCAAVNLDGCLDALLAEGWTQFIEIAPRAVLTPMLKKKSPETVAFTVSDVESFDALLSSFALSYKEI